MTLDHRPTVPTGTQPPPAWERAQPDLLALLGASVAAVCWVLLALPVLRVLGGLLLLVPLQGAAVVLATAPERLRRGLFSTCAAAGAVVTILEVTAAERLGMPLTARAVTVTAGCVTLAGLVGAASRRSRPRLLLARLSPWPGGALPAAAVTGLVLATCLAVVTGSGIPTFSDRAYSTVTLAGPLARTDGVLETPTRRPVPLTVRITNAEHTETGYTTRLALDGKPRGVQHPLVLPPGTARDLWAGDVSVADGCLHRATVTVTSARRSYLVVVYLRGAGAPCPRRAG